MKARQFCRGHLILNKPGSHTVTEYDTIQVAEGHRFHYCYAEDCQRVKDADHGVAQGITTAAELRNRGGR